MKGRMHGCVRTGVHTHIRWHTGTHICSHSGTPHSGTHVREDAQTLVFACADAQADAGAHARTRRCTCTHSLVGVHANCTCTHACELRTHTQTRTHMKMGKYSCADERFCIGLLAHARIGEHPHMYKYARAGNTIYNVINEIVIVIQFPWNFVARLIEEYAV